MIRKNNHLKFKSAQYILPGIGFVKQNKLCNSYIIIRVEPYFKQIFIRL
jgi:hypothetical protein